jgi:glycosyltransferase involved in cell wall biosynthesis
LDSTDITVSVIVPTFNRAEYLPEAIESLLAQERPAEEIIVIDDCSTDRTGEVLNQYQDHIRVIRKKNNGGKPAALNQAIPLALGSYIWIFDDDDVALPDALAVHVDYLSANPHVDFSYSDKFVFSDGGDIWNRGAWRIDRLPILSPEQFLVRTMESMNTLMQGMLVPRRCYREVGLFDESLQRCEDHDMLLRLARRFRGGNVGRPTFVYRDHAGVRGSASDRHAGDKRFAVLFRYRRHIFRRLWEECPLRLYLPGYSGLGEPTGALLARALLQRACVMFRQGLIEEGSTDLQRAMEHLPPAAQEEEWLTGLLSRSIDIDPWTFHDRWRLLRSIDQALRSHGAGDLRRYVGRGLYWNLRRALKKREWWQAIQSSQMLAAYFLLPGSSRVPN